MRVNEQELRQTFVKIGRLMYEKGFILASDGNISARLGPDRLLITPADLHKGMLGPEQMLIVDLEGNVVRSGYSRSANLKPTSELPMHLEAYRQRPDIQAVVHAHPPHAVALSIAGVPMARCLLPEVIVMLGIVPTTEYATPSSVENVRAIRELIRNHDGLVLQRHGSLTVGNSPLQAFIRLETLEQNARIGFMLAQLGVDNPLPPHEVEKLLTIRDQKGYSHATERLEFCQICGTRHAANEAHLPAIQPLDTATSPKTSSLNQTELRELVAQVVQKTLGN
ncbi:class II aldolase/adducin family protein [Candidatus Leptofilum sp.]|uniref:class II aldolase/adducin family protein n=1 Tax=Candidatus Leptofilum sp. TaxID=3241576 RepID=UPI003B5CA9CE